MKVTPQWSDSHKTVSGEAGTVQDLRGLAEGVELDVGAGQQGLSQEEDRILRATARYMGATKADVSPLTPGLSGARAFKFIPSDRGRKIAITVAKVTTPSEVAQEKQAYQQRVAPILRGGSFATLIADLHPAGTRRSVVLYRLAEIGQPGRVTSAFDALSTGSPGAADIVNRARAVCAPWTDNSSHVRVPIGDVRRSLVSDESLRSADPETFAMVQEVEKKQLSFRMCTQHRDLHGENLLIQPDGSVMLIDYGAVNEAPAGLDAAILELSFLAHSKGRAIAAGWPSAENARQWIDLDGYTRGAPERIAAFVRGCREWGLAVSGGANAYVACCYGFAARQLQYDDVDKSLIRGIVDSCLRHLRQS